jgi:hypothetical protein
MDRLTVAAVSDLFSAKGAAFIRSSPRRELSNAKPPALTVLCITDAGGVTDIGRLHLTVGTPRCGVRERPFTWQIHARGRRSAPSLPRNLTELMSDVPSAQVRSLARAKARDEMCSRRFEVEDFAKQIHGL